MITVFRNRLIRLVCFSFEHFAFALLSMHYSAKFKVLIQFGNILFNFWTHHVFKMIFIFFCYITLFTL